MLLAGGARPRGKSRVKPMRRLRTVAVLVAVALALFPSLAQASPTDPLWIGGVYDAGDWDDAVLASAFADAVSKAKPAGAKGQFINRVAVSSTMGPGVKVEPTSLFASAQAQH